PCQASLFRPSLAQGAGLTARRPTRFLLFEIAAQGWIVELPNLYAIDFAAMRLAAARHRQSLPVACHGIAQLHW
ncbi:hypothetical protein, partial [Xanthomonas vasicola]